MKLVAMLRIKNQIKTIHQCLSKLSELVDEIVIVDNGSTDGTLSAYKQYPKVVTIKKTRGYHEGRDKILAHKLAKSRKPDWILWIDADEIFEPSANRAQLDRYMNQPNLEKVEFRMFNLWKGTTHYRVDGVWKRYTATPQRHMWRNLKSAYFRNLKLHNGGVMGISGRHYTSPIRLKHLGYAYPDQLIRKYQVYSKLKNHPRSSKTLPIDEQNLKLMPFKESSNGLVNSFWQMYQHFFWKSVKIVISLITKIQTI